MIIKFWKTKKPFFSNKALNTSKLMLIEDTQPYLEKVCPCKYGEPNIKKSLRLKNLEDIVIYYHNHISVVKIKSSNNTHSDLFTFNLGSSDEIKREILALNDKKASWEGDIPVNILRDAIDTF